MNIQPSFVLIAAGFPGFLILNSWWRTNSGWSDPIKTVTSLWFGFGRVISCKCLYLFMTTSSILLLSIFNLFINLSAISFQINVVFESVSKRALVLTSISLLLLVRVTVTIRKYVWDNIAFSVIVLMLLSTWSGLFWTGISSECINVWCLFWQLSTRQCFLDLQVLIMCVLERQLKQNFFCLTKCDDFR